VIDERLEQLEPHLLRQPALVQLEFGPTTMTERPSSRRASTGSGGSVPACPSAVSDKDFSGRLFARAARGHGVRYRTEQRFRDSTPQYRPPLQAMMAPSHQGLLKRVNTEEIVVEAS